jgi:hypothetical protein
MTVPLIREIARMSGWCGRAVGMLWGYFDESGEHDKSGRLVKLTIGGALARPEVWEAFSLEWAALLESAGLKVFHMTDFEAYQADFKNWTSAQHQDFLGTALDIVGRHLRWPNGYLLGFTNAVRVGAPFKDTYESGLVDAVMFAANASAYQLTEPIALVFARHPEFRLSRIEEVYELINLCDARLQGVTVSEPVTVCPLQLADLIAFEIRCMEREGELRPTRYPLRRLQQLGCLFRFSAAA